MRISILKESRPEENRVALIPESVKKLIDTGVEVAIEPGAGARAFFQDADYQAAGAKLEPDRATLLTTADVLVSIHPLEPEDLDRLRAGTVVIGMLRPLDAPEHAQELARRGLISFALELVPRSTRAQRMDVLSSLATVAGYKAVLMAAERPPRFFPLLMTAAGTVTPAKVLILGAGVAGLQAIATARRLGAVVDAYDVRAAAGEQVKSLGANFIEIDLGNQQTEDAGGYARALTDADMDQIRAGLVKHAKAADVIISTAQVPGRRAPLLLIEEAVAAMKPGSVIVDLAGESGGNCQLTRPGETIERHGVTIMAPLQLPATMPFHASQLYSRNVLAFLQLLVVKGELKIDMADDIIGPSCVTHAGEIVHARVKSAVAAREAA